MARRCKTEEFAKIVAKLRQINPLFNITSDIIVGFPGETEDEWQESLAFIERIGFGHMHIFTYSPREGTKAATLPNPMPEAIKKQRSQALHQLADNMRQAFYLKNVGQQFPVLWEGYSEPVDEGLTRVFGYTPNYLKVACLVAEDKVLANTTTPLTLETVCTEFIVGKL
jgi:threonylcarbamoyladenosine tRNA methylthiotransferase MtaB